jgi:hypothetical protein
MSPLVQQGVPGERVPFLPILCVGEGITRELIDAFDREGVGVVVSYSSARGVQLLKHFRVRAVICLAADVRAVMAAADNNTPVILLAEEDSEWALPGVTVIGRRTPASTLARLVRQVATRHSHSAFVAA